MKKLLINILIFLSLFNITGCLDKKEKILGEMKKNIADQKADYVHLTEINGSLLIRELFAGKLEIFEKEKITKADSVTLKGYNDKGILDYTIVGDSAVIDDRKSIVELYGNVEIFSNSGRLLADYLLWNKEKDEIFAPDKVVLWRDNNKLEGRRMKTNMNFDFVKMIDVKAQGHINEKNISN